MNETTAIERTPERRQLAKSTRTMKERSRHGAARRHPLAMRVAGLGWFSLALGLAEATMPRRVSRFIGVRDDQRTQGALTLLGLREIANGAAIFSGRLSAASLWARFAGDVIDLALLARAAMSPRVEKRRLLTATAMVAGVTAVDAMTAVQLTRNPQRLSRIIEVSKTITVRRQPSEVYRFWRSVENLPQFMEHLESVTVNGRRSRWRAKAPAGTTVEWEAEIVEDVPNDFISWRSMPGATVPNRGSVSLRPAPGDRGTEVLVSLTYEPPAGAIGALVAKLFGEEPGQQVMSDLRRFKQIMEVGEVVRSDASVHRLPHAARPPKKPLDQGKKAGDQAGDQTGKLVQS